MLYIYRASAGSGKTFLLTGFYIELLFRNELTPSLEGRQMLFSEILAVTFTNKATAEMKERIIKELNQLWNEPRLSAYYQKITKPDQQGHVLSDDEIKRRAHHILTSMLEDYSNLHISTIDSFFQQVVRSFARELNVQGNYEIALDAELVLDNAVSQFLLNLDRQRDPETYQWILQFSNNRLQNGDHWNIHKELFKMAKVIITEDYRKISEEIHQIDRPTLSQYIERIDQIKREWLLTLKHIGKECCLWLQRNNLQPEQFSGNSKSQAKVFAQWDSTNQPHEVTGLKTGETYTLRETVAPGTYKLTTDTTFTLKEDGTIDATKTTTKTKNGVLLVEADHPGWIQYLRMYQKFIIKGLNMNLPDLKITSLAFRVTGQKVNLSESYNSQIQNEKKKMADSLNRQEKE